MHVMIFLYCATLTRLTMKKCGGEDLSSAASVGFFKLQALLTVTAFTFTQSLQFFVTVTVQLQRRGKLKIPGGVKHITLRTLLLIFNLFFKKTFLKTFKNF